MAKKLTLVDDHHGTHHVYTGNRGGYVVALCGRSFEPAESSIVNHGIVMLDCPTCIEAMRRNNQCDKCGGNNFIRIRARCKDQCEVILNDKMLMEGLAPGSEMGMSSDSGGDYLIFIYCASCGQILTGNFPVSEDLFSEEIQDNIELKPAGDDWLQKKAIQEDNQPTSVRGSNDK